MNALRDGELGKFEIVNGPDKFELMEALFSYDRMIGANDYEITFGIICCRDGKIFSQPIKVKIDTIHRKNDKDRLWELKGRVNNDPDYEEAWELWSGSPIVVLYSTKTKGGIIEILPKKN